MMAIASRSFRSGFLCAVGLQSGISDGLVIKEQSYLLKSKGDDEYEGKTDTRDAQEIQ